MTGAVDVLLEMRRLKPGNLNDRRRVLSGLGRFEETPNELVIALAEDGNSYTVEGDRKEAVVAERWQTIAAALPSLPPGFTTDEVHVALPKGSRPKCGTLRKALLEGAVEGLWLRGGTGKPTDPWRFWQGEA